jgi:predicted NBD/HSP70 family sugar kinase/sugar phosphate isomerase/epimerase
MVERASSPTRVASASAGEVLQCIRAHGSITRSELVDATGLSRATLGQRLEQLMAHGLVVMEASPSTGGRPPQKVSFNPRAGVILGADLGATHGRIAVADLAGNMIAAHAVELQITRGPEAVLTDVLAHFDDLLVASGRTRVDVWATGVGVPGPVDFASSRPVRPPIMPGWDEFDIRGWFAGQLPGPVLVDNDVNVMAMGEFWRSWLEDVDTLLYVKVGTGIGAGLVIGRSVFRGSRGAAGDIGHVRVDSSKTVVCDCGNENCLEAVASGRALARDLRDAGLATDNTREVVELAASGNPDAVRAVRAAGRRLGEVLATAVNMLNPDVIVVGGDLAAAHDHLLAGVREVVYQRSTALATQSLGIEESRLGDDAGIEGCVVIALEELLSADMIDDLLETRDSRSHGQNPCLRRPAHTRSVAMPAPLSVQLYSLGQAPATDLDGTIARLASIGFAAVEPIISTGASEQMLKFAKKMGGDHLPPAVDATALKRALDDHGMVAPSSHVQLPFGPHAEEILDEQEMLGSTTLVTAALFDAESGSLEAFNDLDRIKELAERFNRASALARSRGMRVGYHNHFWEFATDFDGRSGLEVFYELCEPEVVAEVDIYWALLGGRDPADLVRSLGDRVALLHVKDGNGEPGGTSTSLGDGVLDLPGVLAAATAAEWHVVELEGMDELTVWGALEESSQYLVSHGLSAPRGSER